MLTQAHTAYFAALRDIVTKRLDDTDIAQRAALTNALLGDMSASPDRASC